MGGRSPSCLQQEPHLSLAPFPFLHSRYRGPRLEVDARETFPVFTRKSASELIPRSSTAKPVPKALRITPIRPRKKSKSFASNYGISERQLVRYVKKAPRPGRLHQEPKPAQTAENRLDNIASASVSARSGPRPTVNHGSRDC